MAQPEQNIGGDQMQNYLWLVMLLGAAVDFLLLMGSSALAGSPQDCRRLIPGALLGGVYAGAAASEPLYFLGNWYWRIVFMCIICWVGFGTERPAFRKGILFALLRFALDGIGAGLDQGGLWAMGAGALGLCLICTLFFRDSFSKQYVPVQLNYGGKKIRLTALRDTGNTLRDPMTGRSVMVVGPELARDLAGLSPEQLRTPTHTIFQLPGGRLIPYKTVGNPAGMLLALQVPDVSIGNWRGSCLVAFAPDRLGNGEFQALTGGCA